MEGRWPEDGVLGLALLLMGDSFGPDLRTQKHCHEIESSNLSRWREWANKMQSQKSQDTFHWR